LAFAIVVASFRRVVATIANIKMSLDNCWATFTVLIMVTASLTNIEAASSPAVTAAFVYTIDGCCCCCC
jgi:hypothetical protein